LTNLVKPLDVIWVYDGCIVPPDYKRWVCIEPTLGMFFRINSKPRWQTPIKLERTSHTFLKWDSYLECGIPLELDDFAIEESVRQSGIIGVILPTLAPSIFAAVIAITTIPDQDKEAIRKALGC
jgi:hypothetical protein